MSAIETQVKEVERDLMPICHPVADAVPMEQVVDEDGSESEEWDSDPAVDTETKDVIPKGCGCPGGSGYDTYEHLKEDLESEMGGMISDSEGRMMATFTERINDAVAGVTEDYTGLIEATARGLRTEFTRDINNAVAGVTESYRSEISQTAQGIMTTVNANKRTADGQYSELSAQLTIQSGLIASKVSQTDYDANNVAISQRFSSVEQTADSISSRVTDIESEFGVGGRVTVAESEISQQADLIATKVSQTDYDANNIALANRFSTIEQTSTSISLRVTDIESEFGVGGRVTVAESNIQQNADAIALKVSTTTYEQGLLALRQDLENQIDGAIDTWFYDYSPVPTSGESGLLTNVSPYSDWVAEETQKGTPEKVRDMHVGDIFYDTASGYAYRFEGSGNPGERTYIWRAISDSAVVEALQKANEANALAGTKCRTFVIEPFPPYNVGDLWVKPITLQGTQTTTIYRCVTAKTATQYFSADDWSPADEYAIKLSKSNLEILSDAITGTVGSYTYNADGTLSNESKSTIQQTANSIRLSVSNSAIATALGANGSINSALLDTGIDITHGDITLVANHISLKNQNDVTGLQLITLSSGDVVIDINSLNVSGIFSTSPAWIGTGGVGGERNSVLSDASTAATNMLNTALYGNGGTAQNPTGGIYGSAIFEALEGTSTVIAGGLILSTALILGGNTGTGGDWQEWAGMYGNYDSTAGRGGGPAAWYGGTDLDAFTISNWNTMTPAQKEAYWTSHRYARTMFRQDGSGYLANGEISWSETGSVVIHGATLYDSSNNDISISDLVELKSWFTKVSYTDGNGNTRYAIKLVTGTTAGSIGGFCTDGFITAGGVGSGGGGGGIDLNRVWQSLTNNTDKPNVKINAAHIPYGSGLVLNSTTGLIDAVGAVQSVAGLTGQITASQLQTALGLGAAAYLGVGSVASGNAGLVTGGAVYSAINLALSSAIKIRGVTTTALTDGATTNPIIIDGASYTAVLGDVVLYGGKEYLWIGNKWQQLGDEESWALKTVSITGTGYLTGGGTLSENRTIDISASVKTKINHGETAYSWEDELCFVDPESGEEVIIDDPGTTGTVMWGAESGYRVALDVNGVSKMLLKAGALDNVYTRLSDLQAAVGSLVMVNTIAGVSGAITLGTGLTMVGNELSVTGPTIGTVTRVDLGNTQYNPSSAGVVSLPAYPTTLPASDVYAWAKAANKPTYAFSEITGTASTSQIPDLSYTKIIGLGDAATRGVASTIGSSVTALVPGSLLYSVLGDAFDSSNTVKAFVNSSIATATATFRGTNTTATTESAFLTWANGLTHDLNDYIFWGTIDGDGNTVYKRYKYNGTSWAFEYDLNNSSFTSAQWAAISSGITSVLVAAFNAKYDKPSGGIPKSDLASAVQASLVLADGSLQGGWVFERNSAIYDSEDYVHVN